MVRKLALAVSLALGTLSVPAHALGLGELNSRSVLNQNFNGEITLLSISPEELDGIRVRLAGADAFERAGVERPFFLSRLRFEPVLGDGGRPVVRVTSDFPIREPFLNFLVEVNWPNGRLLREYTVLLDPPTTTSRRPPAVTPAARPQRAASAPAARPATVAATSAAPGGEYGPVRANETAWKIASKVRPQGVSMEQMMMALLNANPQAFVDGDINRLRRGQILRVPAVDEIQQLSRQQARDAYRAQQDAWLARRDQRLQARDAQAAAPAPEPAATTDADDQLRIASARPEGEGEAGAAENAAQSSAPDELRSRLIAARENAETSRQEAETLRSRVDDLQARLADMQKLLSLKDEQLAQLQDRMSTADASAAMEGPEPAPEAATEPGPEVAVVPQPTAAETGDVAEPAGEDAVADLVMANQVPAMSEMTGGDYRIADIAPQVDPDRIVVEFGSEPTMTTALAAGSEIDPAAGPGDEIVVDATGIDAASPVIGGPEVAVLVEPDNAVVVDATQTAQPEAPVADAPSAMADADPVTAQPEPSDNGSAGLMGGQLAPYMDMLEKNIVPVAVGSVLLLGLVGWAATRRGKPAEEAPLLVTPEGVPVAADEPRPVERKAAEPVVDHPADDLPESALLDELSPGDINALQDETGEVDPVSEADVYIAYGRYQQAEELLKQALDREPDRLALKHKLLEVYYATRNPAAFGALAGEMVDNGQDAVDAAAWTRAQDMGRELDPQNPLFAREGGAPGPVLAGAGAAAGAAAAASGTVDDDTLSLTDLDLSELNSAYAEETGVTADLEAPSEVSILLDEPTPSDPISTVTPDSISMDELDSLEFELSSMEQEAADEDELASDSFDLDSMMKEAEEVAADSTLSLDSEFSADELQAQLDQLSDLSVLDSNLTPDAEPPANLGLVEEDRPAQQEGLDPTFDIDAAFDQSDDGDDRDGSPTSGFASADAASAASGEADGVGTKLDLARAYVEMGDNEGARSILEEVIVEGNDAQRGDAKKMLSGLG